MLCCTCTLEMWRVHSESTHSVMVLQWSEVHLLSVVLQSSVLVPGPCSATLHFQPGTAELWCFWLQLAAALYIQIIDTKNKQLKDNEVLIDEISSDPS